MKRGVTEAYERQLWGELNTLLADYAERAILLAVRGHDAEIHDLYEQVERLAQTDAGYLRERMEEDNPVSAIRRRLSLLADTGQQW